MKEANGSAYLGKTICFMDKTRNQVGSLLFVSVTKQRIYSKADEAIANKGQKSKEQS